MHAVIELLAPLRQTGAKLGPYVLLELLLPGGTLFALLLFLYQQVRSSAGNAEMQRVSPPAMVSAACSSTSQKPDTLRIGLRKRCSAVDHGMYFFILRLGCSTTPWSTRTFPKTAPMSSKE